MAKIAGVHVPCLVAKKTAGGIRFYWQPSATLAKAGWKAQSLGQELAPAIAAAELRNAEIAAWRTGGGPIGKVKTYAERMSMAALIRLYKEHKRYTTLAKSSQIGYASTLRLIEKWATENKSGDIAVASITRKSVEGLRDALMAPDAKGVVMHHRAHTTLKILRTLFQFAKKGGFITVNPAEDYDLIAPEPRHQVWSKENIEAFKSTAIAMGYPSVAFAVEIAEYTGQREGDIMRMGSPHIREMHGLDPETHRHLAGPDGRVVGIYMQQSKTKAQIGIPIYGDIRTKIEKAIADNARRDIPIMTILAHERTGRPWVTNNFSHVFLRIRLRAIELGHTELTDLQFRDLRRTCIVRMGERNLEDAFIASISGHRLQSIKKILEVYLPRNDKMAARAIVAMMPKTPFQQTSSN